MEMMTRNLLDVLRSNNALMAADYLLVYVIKDKVRNSSSSQTFSHQSV